MRILVVSDTHREFNWDRYKLPPKPNPSEYDLIVFAGDIGVGLNGMAWANEFDDTDKPRIYINGNHEFYGHDFYELRMLQEQLGKGEKNNFHLLDPGVVEIDDVVFIGATLWSRLGL